MSDESLAALTAQVELLEKQVKKHQLFREKHEEAEKQAAAGVLYLRIARLVSVAEKPNALTEAATCFSRAKRLCRDLVKGRASTEGSAEADD